MPKTSKKSKASKSTGLRKRFDLTNKKVQFFVVIAIVAILGGGWFTYKSFAANTIYTLTPSIGSNTGINCLLEGSGCVTRHDTSKNNIPVTILGASVGNNPKKIPRTSHNNTSKFES